MSHRELGEGRDLASRRLTYNGAGITMDPTRFSSESNGRRFEASRCIGSGDVVWTAAATALMGWQVKTRSGFCVEDSSSRNAEHVSLGRLWLIAKIGPLRIHEPIEIIAIVDEHDQKGYAYGTLEGHPVNGEEAFVLERKPDDSVWLTIRSVTWRTRGLWRLATPVVRVLQPFYRWRYLRSL